jgi:hypothetical protein
MQQNKIPKIIHYCWFGRNPLPKLATDCIASWKKYLPDYKIIEWNEDNFPLEKFRFAQEALEARKFAFVSDVCRLYALKEMGGVYMDTDVEVLKSLDVFLKHNAFSGFENDDFVPTGIMASEPDGTWVTELLNYYKDLSFVRSDGTFYPYSNTFIITQMMVEKGFIMNNSFQEMKDYVSFYSNDYFCPKSYKTGKIELTSNSYCIHHFAKSWVSNKIKWKHEIKMKLMSWFGSKKVQHVIDLIKK